MKVNLLTSKLEMTPAIKSYVEEKMGMLDKYLGQTTVLNCDVEVSKVAGSQAKGEVFRAEANLQIPGTLLRVEKTENDLYKAIDKMKDHLAEVIKKHKDKERDKHR